MIRSVEFLGRAFCFTGKLVDLKRVAAEREVRARGGLILDRINEHLDYLVVGDEASPGWKFGAYGRKIEQARTLFSTTARPALISESMFMEALVHYPCIDSGVIDEKVVVINFKFLLGMADINFDQDRIEVALGQLSDRYHCHITAKGSWASVHSDLFGAETGGPESDGALVVEYRFVRHQPLDSPTAEFIEAVGRAFEGVPGVDGTLRWFERSEGSADFVRLLQEVPRSLRISM